MRITHDAEADALYIELRDVPAKVGREITDGVTVDLDAQGHVIGLEILDARERIGDAVLADSVPVKQLASKAALVPSH